MNQQTQQLLKTFIRDVTAKNKVIEVIDRYLSDVKPLDTFTKQSEIPFSSERKYSACVYKDSTLVLGAPEMLLEKGSKAFEAVTAYTKEAYRVVVFGLITGAYRKEDENIKKEFTPQAIIAMDDPIREEIPKALLELTKNNIEYRIISGDSPDTVISIAKKINKDYPANIISGQELETLSEDAFEQAVLTHNIFARIKPSQKQMIIRALKKHKLFTIMVGDGVNDVLAIKESDLGVAMNGGSTMAKDVADVVLLNNSFATLPLLLYEGRRIITNIQTIANIYLIKNISSIAAILLLGFIGLQFPFNPKHVEIASFLIIGLPSFFLAFEKHTFSTTDEGFLKRLLLFSSIVGFGNAIIYAIVYMYYDIASERLLYSRTMLLCAVIFLGINNLVLIYSQHYRFEEILKRKIPLFLIVGITMLFLIAITNNAIRGFFDIANVTLLDFSITFFLCAVGSMIIAIVLKKTTLLKQL